MDRGAWRATVHGVAKSWTRLTDTCTQETKIPYAPRHDQKCVLKNKTKQKTGTRPVVYMLDMKSTNFPSCDFSSHLYGGLVAKSCPTLVAGQAPLSMGFSSL